ncbi:ras GEF, partial [Hortaea werneckii]
TFAGKIAQVKIFTVAAKEISGHLELVQEDDDTDWACNDKEREASGSRESSASRSSSLIDDPNFGFMDALSGSTLLDDKSTTATIGDETIRSASGISISSSQIMAHAEAAQKAAQLLQPAQRQQLSKIQWRALEAQPDDLIAKELTRMDWVMFSSIRPRDLVRQVSMSEKARCKSLIHVNRMIEHFNQVAAWVKNYVLFRDKPKHRAIMLEKMMRIGRKLREMNNYNALGAIIAGIKSSCVQRLAATRELISPQVGKDYARLELLMGSSKSHAAYRLAWENSSSERIPYLPLHLRDLASAEQGSSTYLGASERGRINWKKFEIMGEVVVGMQRAQGSPYKGLGGSRGEMQVKELVLDVKLEKDEEILYERSIHLEPSPGSAGPSEKFKQFFKR